MAVEDSSMVFFRIMRARRKCHVLRIKNTGNFFGGSYDMDVAQIIWG
jgi:hypothetical protein